MIVNKRRGNNFLNNIWIKARQFFNSRTFYEWLDKTLLRVLISFILLVIVFIIQISSFQGAKNILNTVKSKLEHTASIKAYISDLGNLYNNVKEFGNKAIEAISMQENTENRLLMPVHGDITTYFNDHIGGNNKSKGLVFATDLGQGIYAVDSGVILEIGSNKAIGNYIIIKHRGELLSVYKYVGNNLVELNERVEKGQVIGTSSEKLLFEIWYRNEAVDPIEYIDLTIEQL